MPRLKKLDHPHSTVSSQTSSATHEESDCSLGIAPSQVFTTNSPLHSPMLPLITKLDLRSPLSTSDAGECISEKEALDPLESCSRPVCETICLSDTVVDPSQDLTIPTATSSAGSLPSTQVHNKFSLHSCSPNALTRDVLTLHANIPSDTDVLMSGLQDLQLCTPPRDLSSHCR